MLGFKPKRTNLHEEYDYPKVCRCSYATGEQISTRQPSGART